MNYKPVETLDCKFSLLHEGRTYSGNHRKYIIENARDVCYSGPTRELIKLREAFGYYGHGRRVLSGRMALPEVDVVTLPDGSKAMINNIPSNVTTKFEILEDGTVSHTQDILDTEPGRIVSGLNKSRVGGFSWACSGSDGGRVQASKIKSFNGFDYVLQPGFSSNRGYLLESAQVPNLLESVSAIVGDEKKAEMLVAGWRLADGETVKALEDEIFESESKFFKLTDEKNKLEKDLATMITENATSVEQLAAIKKNFAQAISLFAENSPVIIPEEVQHAMLEGDFSRAKAIFESAKLIDYESLPLGLNASKKVVNIPYDTEKKVPIEGSAGYGLTINL